MSTVLKEYERFITWLAGQAPENDVKRLANIIFQKLHELVPAGTAARKRSKILAPFATDLWGQTSIELDEHEAAHLADERQWTRLHQLQVGPFRGFKLSETFELQKQITLIYGANGAGKSSFCEALELSLLGEVSEADVKRIQGDAYFRNAWAGTYARPSLTVLSAEGHAVPVPPNEEEYRFCFVEKNRIDAFSRLASRTTAEKTKLIATLFGIDQFAEFVRGFSDELDPQLDLLGVKSQQLAIARLALRTAEESVAAEVVGEAAYRGEEHAVCAMFPEPISYDELRAFIGSPEKPGRLEEIRKTLEQPLLPTLGVTQADLNSALHTLSVNDKELLGRQEKLASRSSEVSFQQLFTAVEALQEQMPDRCPACDTPLYGDHIVLHDPYEKAKEGLVSLGELAKLQGEIKTIEDSLAAAATAFHNLLTKISASLQPAGVQVPQLGQINQRWWETIGPADGVLWCKILEVASTIEQQDERAAKDLLSRTAFAEERVRLEEIDRLILGLEGRKTAWKAELNAAHELIEKFEADNRELILEVAHERPRVELQHRIKRAYDSLVPMLRRYLGDLPGTLLADLGETTKDLYNAFNREDRHEDKLAQLWLPTAPEGKIELAFCDSPLVRRDALHILSEGHIRCLGLALLVAKNIKQNSPVLIFDDAVNAIDDDHRDGIWRTIFEDGWLGEKQVILTCHGQEFIKTIQQGLGAERVKTDCAYYELLPHDGDHHPLVDTQPPTKNYVLSAQEYLARQNSRDALSQSRRALESLSKQLWKWISKLAPDPVKLTYRAPGAKPELRNLCEQLKAILAKPQFVHARKEQMLAALTQLLGINGASPEWAYLNSGTHEDERFEFDRGTVRGIVDALTQIDMALR
ncbi:AAA family ATPase [Pseudomonas sp. GM60]|uniref:AAA family ATPase n=1 Tax=Pseudomonas sp. GM60 TaxID=1144334 RepID=UPI00027096D9|nr:ATP-binding protein [Pseudomonas sp. GM60]EJM74051.1 RecF/RecN/SMC N-terminal domain-containing protein [Pseudomonas sp. GM60]